MPVIVPCLAIDNIARLRTVAMSLTATFSTTSFAEGRFRRAYKGTWTEGPHAGRKCVTKECKKQHTWKATDYDTTVEIYEKAKELATGFNSKTTRPIYFTEVHVMRVTKQGDPSATLKLHEYCTCEDYIAGAYKKYCNNYGYIDSSAHSLQAFMHWSWWRSDSEVMVSDLQGVRKDEQYMLTDPAICSLAGGYGETDTGVEGMIMFFLRHQCNEFCSTLPKPSLRDFIGIIPQELLSQCKTLAAQIGSSTTYKVELNLPAGVKRKVGEVFRTTAQRS